MFDQLKYDDLLMLRDGVDILQPDDEEAQNRQARLVAELDREIDDRRPRTRDAGVVDPQLETAFIAIQATLDSVRVSPEPITGEEALRMLVERLEDDGLEPRIKVQR